MIFSPVSTKQTVYSLSFSLLEIHESTTVSSEMAKDALYKEKEDFNLDKES